MREIGEKYRKAIKKDHFKYLNKHLLIHTMSVLALFSMTGIVSYLYLTNLKLLLDYLIAWASLAVLSVGVLAIDSIFLVRYLCKIDSENKLKSTFKVDHPMSPIPYKDTGCSKMSVYTF